MTETKMAEMEQTTSVNLNLTLNDVPYDEKYRLNQASVTQLVRGLQEMANRLSEPTNDYQKELYPALKTIVNNFVNKYIEILQCTSEVEREVKRFNLHGYSGKLKNAVLTKGVKYSLVYKFANFGDYLKSVTQRMKYIMERQLPQRYVTNSQEGTSYSSLKTQVQEFLTYLSEVENSWNTVVSSARTIGGSNVQENLRKRTEKQQIKSQNVFKKITQHNKEHYYTALDGNGNIHKTKYHNDNVKKSQETKESKKGVFRTDNKSKYNQPKKEKWTARKSH